MREGRYGILLSLLIGAPSHAQPFIDVNTTVTGVRQSSVAWADFDNDSDLDLAVSGNASGFVPTAQIWRNDNGSFVNLGAPLTGVTTSALAWGDYDADGDPDLIITGDLDPYNGVPTTRLYRNDGGNGSGGWVFTPVNSGILNVRSGAVAWGDFDNDNDLDLAIAGLYDETKPPATRIYRNTGGVFADIGASLIGVEYCSLDWADYDGDHDLDLAVAGVYGASTQVLARVYRNQGGVFSDIAAGLTGVKYCSLDWGDYDNDADPDLIVAGQDAGGNPSTQVYRNDGTNGSGGWLFTPVPAGIVAVDTCALAWGDLENDGQRDLVIAGSAGGARTTRVYRYDGADTFSPITASLVGVNACSVAWGDYDDDGDLDLVLAGQSNSGLETRIYRNDGLCGDPAVDSDADTVTDCHDNCPLIPNGPADPDNQTDADGDGFGNACDNCPLTANPYGQNADSDNDGVGDACDECVGTPPDAIVDPRTGCIPIPADFDANALVDGDDFLLFDSCYTGPAIPYAPLSPTCLLFPDYLGILPADLDRDGDVDHTDFGLFQRCIVDVNSMADPHCAD